MVVILTYLVELFAANVGYEGQPGGQSNGGGGGGGNHGYEGQPGNQSNGGH